MRKHFYAAAKNYFDEKKSTSFQGTDRNFFLGFLGGGTNGTVAIETVSVRKII